MEIKAKHYSCRGVESILVTNGAYFGGVMEFHPETLEPMGRGIGVDDRQRREFQEAAHQLKEQTPAK